MALSPPLAAWLAAGCVLALLTYPLAVAWLGLAGLFALAALRWRQRGSPFPASPFSLPIALFLLGACIGLHVSLRPAMAWVRIFGLFAALGVFSLVLDLAATPRAARRLAAGVLFAALLIAPLLFLLILPEEIVRLPAALRAALSWTLPTLASVRESLLDIDEGLMHQRYRFFSSGLGMLAAYASGLALGPLLVGSRHARLLALLALVLCALFLLLAASRGAMLSTILALCLVSATRQRWLLVPGLLALGLAVTAVAGLLSLRPIFQAIPSFSGLSASTESWFSRLDVWSNALTVLGDFRFSGTGLGLASARVVASHAFPDNGFTHAHSALLQTYLEQGLLGIAGLSGLIGVGLAFGWRALRRVRDPAARSPLLSASAGSLALLLTGLVDVGPVTTVGTVLLFGTLALLVAADKLEPHPALNSRPTPPPRGPSPEPALSNRLLHSLGWPALGGSIALVTCVGALLAVSSADADRPPAPPRSPWPSLASAGLRNLGGAGASLDRSRRCGAASGAHRAPGAGRTPAPPGDRIRSRRSGSPAQARRSPTCRRESSRGDAHAEPGASTHPFARWPNPVSARSPLPRRGGGRSGNRALDARQLGIRRTWCRQRRRGTDQVER